METSLKVDKPSVIRETDEESRVLARTLLRESRSVAMAVQEPGGTGFPFVSRVLLGIDSDGFPTILVSALSAHTTALSADARCSLLAGETGKGDPLAHPRLTLQCEARPVERDSDQHVRIRSRFLRRHPKAKLYVDFPDFRFFRLEPLRASLNGGFGRAYLLEGSEFRLQGAAVSALSEIEEDAIAHMNSDHADAIENYARGHLKSNESGWAMVGIDIAGIDLLRGDQLRRIDFVEPLAEAGSLRSALKYLRI